MVWLKHQFSFEDWSSKNEIKRKSLFENEETIEVLIQQFLIEGEMNKYLENQGWVS